MVTQAEKDAIALEYDSEQRSVEWALYEYCYDRAIALSFEKGDPERTEAVKYALASRRAYWNARKAAGL